MEAHDSLWRPLKGSSRKEKKKKKKSRNFGISSDINLLINWECFCEILCCIDEANMKLVVCY
ncbi:hypothetical protein EXN66_Car007348 [Channa argus]|uniref:Uncharacterized protein n=1 Tax=Channa argus TaxID=215402 RepID=A0A6G1PNC3_CHAAH|nr:hypothetical protein EXN66_Car007348 [Channa argus]